MTWNPIPSKASPSVWYLLYQRPDGDEVRMGPLAEEQARGMVSEWSRLKPELHPVLEEWGPKGSWTRVTE